MNFFPTDVAIPTRFPLPFIQRPATIDKSEITVGKISMTSVSIKETQLEISAADLEIAQELADQVLDNCDDRLMIAVGLMPRLGSRVACRRIRAALPADQAEMIIAMLRSQPLVPIGESLKTA